MSNSSIDGKLKVLEERFENELRLRREGEFPNEIALGTPRPVLNRRPRPAQMFSNREIPAFPPRNQQATETEHQMREVYKVSGKLNVDGTNYSSHIDDLIHQGELGSGTCGHVVKMLHRPSGAVIAVKQMRRSGNSEETKRILMDLDVVVRSHDCPYIVRCLGCFVTDADVWICMELMASCFDKLLKRLNAPIPEEILGKVTFATVNALSYLKEMHGVIHRDVKPSNILLDKRGNIKLCDFGISGRLVDSKAKTRSAGCAAYMAPERIDPPDPTRPDYDIRADVWSLGISLVELATGVFPYRDCHNDFEVLTRVIADDPPRLPKESDFTPEFKSFVSQCLTKNYRHRPKYAKLLEHPFVVRAGRSRASVADWYAALPAATPNTPAKLPLRPSIPVPPATVPSTAPSPFIPPVTSSFNPITSTFNPVPSPAVPQTYPAEAQPYPAVPKSYPSIPQTYPSIPQSYPSIPQSYPSIPQSYPSIPQSYPSLPQSYPAVVSPPLSAVTSSAQRPVEISPAPAPRNFVTSAQHWMPEHATPTPHRARWGSIANAGGSSSQPTSLEVEYYNNSPFPRRRTLECASPPPPPARRVSADNRWKPSPVNSGNTSPIVLQRFYHQNQQRKSRVDLHSTPRHRSLSREGSAGRSPEPPPRTHRHANTQHLTRSTELEPPSLQERLHPPSPLLLHNDRLSEGRSQSLTRAELRNGFRTELTAPVQAAQKLHHDDQDGEAARVGACPPRPCPRARRSSAATSAPPL